MCCKALIISAGYQCPCLGLLSRQFANSLLLMQQEAVGAPTALTDGAVMHWLCGVKVKLILVTAVDAVKADRCFLATVMRSLQLC